MSRNLQIATAFVDSTGLCLFVAFVILDMPEGLEGIVEMCNARYGWNKTVGDYLEMGKQALRDERSFNKAAGIGQGADNLPDFFRKEALPPHNVVFEVPKEELDMLFDGRIVQHNKPEFIMRRPENEQVARLVGMDNIIPSCVTPLNPILPDDCH